MPVTVNSNNSPYSFSSYNHHLNSVEAWIGRALRGDMVNPDGDYEAHTSYAGHDYLTTSITLDDNSALASNDFFDFDRVPTPSGTPHGLLTDQLVVEQYSGLDARNDALNGLGMAVFGTETTVTTFMGTGASINDVLIEETQSLGEDYDTNSQLIDLDDINIGGGGPGGDNYALTYNAHSFSSVQWDGFDIDIEVFLDASDSYRAGNQAPLLGILNSYEYDYSGSDYDDIIEGYAMNDIFRSSLGTNMLSGNGGNDWYFLGDGSDIINDSSGYDTVQFSNASTLDWETDIYTGDIANDFIAENEIERVLGSSGNDRIVMSLSGTNVHAVQGLGGNDQIGGNARDNRLDGGSGTDSLYGYDGDDFLNGGSDNDYLEGGNGNDELLGGNGNDFLYGEDGDDILEGGSGGDFLNGGLNNFGGDTLSYSGSLVGVTVYLATGGVTGGHATGDTITGFENVSGTWLVDYLLGDAGNNTINGIGGADWLYGGDGTDTMYGGSGADFMYGDAGADIMFGGADGDFMFGGADNDTMHGDDGIDWLRGEDGSDFLYGNAGNDVLFGGNGFDYMFGGDDSDTFYGEAGNDYITGQAGGDVAFGQDGDDIIFGGSEGDFLFGGTGRDTINGGTENDLMWGDAAGTGDGVEDVFVFDTNWGFDAIYDFELGIDEISFNSIAGLTQFSDLTVMDGGANVSVIFGADAITLYDVTFAELNANQADFDFG